MNLPARLPVVIHSVKMKTNWSLNSCPRLLHRSQHPDAGGASYFWLLLISFVAIPAAFAADTASKPALAVDLPAGWAAADIGPVRKAGSVRYEAAAKSFSVTSPMLRTVKLFAAAS